VNVTPGVTRSSIVARLPAALSPATRPSWAATWVNCRPPVTSPAAKMVETLVRPRLSILM
jgi:hypothetical protein